METKLDQEWVTLIIEAKNMGITLDDIKLFLETRKSRNKED